MDFHVGLDETLEQLTSGLAFSLFVCTSLVNSSQIYSFLLLLVSEFLHFINDILLTSSFDLFFFTFFLLLKLLCLNQISFLLSHFLDLRLFLFLFRFLFNLRLLGLLFFFWVIKLSFHFL